MILSDLGATVIKIERPGLGDEARRLGPRVGEDSAYFMSINRGKKSVTLDLSKADGRDLARELSKRVDVFVENFVPGTMKKLGLDYAQLCSLNPGLIYASISGFGQDGPYAQYPALDIIVQAMGGLMSITGEPNSRPLRPGVSLGDSVAGIFAATAIVVALWNRERSGRGSYVDMSMFDCQVTLLENAFSRFFATGQVPGPLGSRHPAAVPFEEFATLDGHIVVAIISDNTTAWTGFCKAIGHSELAEDPRFANGRARFTNYDLLSPIMNAALLKKSTQEWLTEFTRLGVPCGPVNNIGTVVNDPQVKHRGMIAKIPHKTLGSWSVANTPFRFEGKPAVPQGSSPDLGEHTIQILEGILGLSSADVAALKSRGVI